MALTFNLPSQIVVQTSAQWAADNTVYSAKRILVTSDANWDSTDQRKFKIADGTQTWSQLDYPPIGYETMTTSAGEFKFSKTTAGAVLLWTNGQDMRFSASVGGAPAFILKTDGTIILENGTPNKFLKTGASKEITLVDNPVDVNTIGSAINGATSATPNDTDLVMSVDTSVAKKNTWTQIKAFLKTYFDTVYQAAGTYLTSANITQTITNGVTDKAPSEDAVYDALALKLDTNNSAVTDARDLKYAAYSNTDSSHTGNTNETYLKGLLVPNLTTNSTLDILGLLNKTGTAGNITWNLYYNTTNDLTGSPVKISTSTQTAAQLYGGKFIRTIINKNSLTDNYIYRANVTSINDFTQNASAMTSLGVDLSSKYLIITATLANSGDTAILSAFQLIHTRP